MLNGIGLRVVLWVSGCEHKCIGCHNPITWNHDDGVLFTDETKQELFEQLDKPYIRGITFSGGDALSNQNRHTILSLAKEIKSKYTTKDIWLYTGYLWEDIKNLENIQYIDVIIDGKFNQENRNKNPKVKWRGDDLQKIIDVKQSLIQSIPILYLP